MKKMIVLMIGLGVILGGCRKKEKQEAASGQAAPEILVNRPAPVSYTHLDVYKRQVHFLTSL